MPTTISKYFGNIEYLGEAVYEFPAGLPGFEEHRSFLFLTQPTKIGRAHV